MTKNIIVVDANGKKIGTTYLKRAKGLVKQGRARFLTQNMLCLACPPNQYLEDNNMSEQTIENIVTENTAAENVAAEDMVTESTVAENEVPDNTLADSPATEGKYTMEYCLGQIAEIGHQTEYLNQVISELRRLDNDNSYGQKAVALGNVVVSREKTNQQMLRFYEKMYDDLKTPAETDVISHKARLQEQLLKIMDNTLENGDFPANEVTDMFNGAFDAIRHIND